MLLDKRESVLENLDIIKKTYLKLVVLKQLEQEAYEENEYDILYELSEDERLLVEDINNHMKYIVADLIILRDEKAVRQKLSEIDELQETVVRESLMIIRNITGRVEKTKKRIESLKAKPGMPKHSSLSTPQIVNIRA